MENGKIFWIDDGVPYDIGTNETVMEVDFDIKYSRKRIRLPSNVSNLAYCTSGCWFVRSKHLQFFSIDKI